MQVIFLGSAIDNVNGPAQITFKNSDLPWWRHFFYLLLIHILDYSKYLKDMNDDGLSTDEKNMISRIKIARQKAINRKVEDSLTQQEKISEKM